MIKTGEGVTGEKRRAKKKTLFVNENIIKMFLISLMHNGYPGEKKIIKNKFLANCAVVYF